MSTPLLVLQEISADAPMTVYFPAYPQGHQIFDFMVKMKTHTVGAGQLLITLRYDDTEGPQDLNVALNLTAGNYVTQPFPDEYVDTNQDISLQFTFLAAGGTCDCEILMRQS